MSIKPVTAHQRLIHWLIKGLELDTTIFHVGQYCNAWRASTEGRASASFHVILKGQCYFHRPDQPSILLKESEAVFLLRDIPHSLTPFGDANVLCSPQTMQPLSTAQDGTTGLACGFFQFRGVAAEFLTESFPDYLILRSDSLALQAAASLFDLMREEAVLSRGEEPSPLLNHLAELLLFYLVRDMAQTSEIAAGLWAVASRPAFAQLLERLLEDPSRHWSVEQMAQVTHMSRARFFKHFVDTCEQSPAQFLVSLRMNIAARKLRKGVSVLQAAESVGYQSPAAFTRAFKKVMGLQPGAYQKNWRASVLS